MRKPRVLITGAAGFIGSHMAEKMTKDGWEVVGLDNLKWYSRIPRNTVVGDVRDTQLVDNLVSIVDEVRHLAAQINVDYGNEHPQETVDININGTINVLEACKKHKKPLIFASTSEVYGTAQTASISEVHPLDASSVYAASKVGADRLCKAYRDAFGLDVKILRNFNTFGHFQRRDSYGGVIAIFVERALHNQPPIIYGDGEQERDYIWIDDALRGYELIAEMGQPGVPINIGSGQAISINRIAELVQKFTGCPDPIHVAPRPGEVRRLCADTTLANSLGFKCQTSFEENLEEYINWRRKMIG